MIRHGEDNPGADEHAQVPEGIRRAARDVDEKHHDHRAESGDSAERQMDASAHSRFRRSVRPPA